MRRCAAWLLICCFLIWGPLDSLPLACAARPVSTAPAIAAHQDYCHCAACAGGLRCCCKPAHTPARAAFLKARCEEQHTLTLVAHAKYPIALPTVSNPLYVVYGLPLRFVHEDTLRLLPLSPPNPPPCRA